MLFFYGREIYGYGYHFICGTLLQLILVVWTFVSKKQEKHTGLVLVLSLWTKFFGVTFQMKALL